MDTPQKESSPKPKAKKQTKKLIVKKLINIPGYGTIQPGQEVNADMKKAFTAYVEKTFNDGGGKYKVPVIEDFCK